MRDNLPSLLANIFALWTLENSQHFFEAKGENNQDSYLLRPHSAQVICIFRLLGVGYYQDGKDNDGLQKNLIQIGTGEGKSITLAVTSIVLALFGFNVSCACYSASLSRRDYESFKNLFIGLKLETRINYGNFAQVCEQIINKHGDVRDIIINSIQGQKQINNINQQQRPYILLIDEVDVFFSTDFYGKNYTPFGQLRHPTINELIKYIWNNKLDSFKISFTQIINTQEFKNLCLQYQIWQPLIEESVKNLIFDVNNYKSQEYVVKDNKIGYKEQDGLNFNAIYGYKTLFANYHEFEQNNITEQRLYEFFCLEINCGSFSYSEIPKNFCCIIGVTGTLETLSEAEKDIIENEYKIKQKTIMPSVFGSNNLIFNKNQDTKIENSDDYFNRIKQEIDNRLIGQNPLTQRAVLVFFEDKQKLMDFYNSQVYHSLNEKTKILTEEASNEERNSLINQAGAQGNIIFMTKAFGRGTDFKITDETVQKNGGVHVIQTFLSEEFSEEVQIKGRTARQGGIGSYSLILQDIELEKYQITKKDIDLNKDKGNIYYFINDKRNFYFNSKYNENKKFNIESLKLHQQTQRLLESIKKEDFEFAKTFLIQQNKGISQDALSRTLILLDGTGSMSNLLLKIKIIINDLIEKCNQVLIDNKYYEGCFEIQIAIYRNYNVNEDLLLEHSGWEIKPNSLRKFLDNVKVAGGMGAEAVEVGFQFANQQHKIKPITQIILIGDAPAQSKEEVISRRKGRLNGLLDMGEKYWQQTKFAQITDYLTELDIIIQNKIPVHSFYVDKYAKICFETISKKSNGKSEFLDVNAQKGSEDLQDFISQQVLLDVGKKQGIGEQMVEQYYKMQQGYRK